MTQVATEDPKIAQIVDVISRLAAGDLQARAVASKHGDSFDDIITGLNMLAEEFSTRYDTRLETKRRVDEILDVVAAIAQLSFSKTVPVSDAEDPLDALAVGINMIGEELSRSHKRLLIFEKAVETTKAGITIRDCDNKILYTNPADVAMHGYDSVSDLTGKDTSIYGVPEAVEPLTPEKIARMEGWTRESVNMRKDGSFFPVYLTSDIIRDDDGKPIGLVTVCEDISERKATEEQLRKTHRELQDTVAQVIHSAKLAALGEMAAGVAHELNQPLNNIKLIMQSTLRDIEKNRYDISGLVSDSKEVVGLVTKMARTIDHMRAFTRKSIGCEQISVDVNASITNALGLLQEQLCVHSIQVEKQLCSELLLTLAAPNNVEQVFLNLLTNARDIVLKRLENDKHHDGRIVIGSYLLNNAELCVDIQDNGGGVSSANLSKIFDPFFTTKETGKGTGLGLSISQRIVAECGGRIEVDVQKGEGTTFRVILPVSKTEDEEK